MGDPDILCYNIKEIFTSIQGEGRHMGKPATFIRFNGCNLNCSWCDTKQDDDVMLRAMNITSILSQITCSTIVLTGGEPSIQRDIYSLIVILMNLGYKVHVETNGVAKGKSIGRADWITLSPKPENGWLWDPECFPSEIKYVIDGAIDIGNISRRDDIDVWLMPKWDGDKMDEDSVKKAQFFTSKLPNTKLGIQAHKFWGIQ